MSSGKSEIPCKKITRFNGLELVPKGKSSIYLCYLAHLGQIEISKNHCHETFLTSFWLITWRKHVILYRFYCITKLKCHLYRSVLKYSLFTRHLNYYKKCFYIFLCSTYKRMSNLIKIEKGYEELLDELLEEQKNQTQIKK